MSEQGTFDSKTFSQLMMAFGETVALQIAPIASLMSSIGTFEVSSFIAAIQANTSVLNMQDFEIQLTLNKPERWQFEPLVDWYDRLERADLISKYEYRLMYGKECWRAVLHSPIWYAGEVWDWFYNALGWIWDDVRELWEK
jgi:hypothetical protein